MRIARLSREIRHLLTPDYLARLQLRMNILNISNKELAAIMGESASELSKVLTGKLFSFRILIDVCRALSVPFSDLLTEEGKALYAQEMTRPSKEKPCPM